MWVTEPQIARQIDSPCFDAGGGAGFRFGPADICGPQREGRVANYIGTRKFLPEPVPKTG